MIIFIHSKIVIQHWLYPVPGTIVLLSDIPEPKEMIVVYN